MIPLQLSVFLFLLYFTATHLQRRITQTELEMEIIHKYISFGSILQKRPLSFLMRFQISLGRDLSRSTNPYNTLISLVDQG